MGPKSLPPFLVIATAAVNAGLRWPPLIPIVTVVKGENLCERRVYAEMIEFGVVGVVVVWREMGITVCYNGEGQPDSKRHG